MRCTKKQIGNQFILYDANYLEDPDSISFDKDEWRRRNAITGSAQGRGTTIFIKHEGRELVLRHYQRGGMVARFLTDQYLWMGLHNTRVWQEWHLLTKLRQLGLPVPVPVTARVIRRGLFYTADIITQRLEHTITLIDSLSRQKMGENHWQRLGAILRQFHDNGIYHADLNASNILLNTDNEFFLLDFDRGYQRKPLQRWQQANLARLKRSLDKTSKLVTDFYFCEQDWQYLLKGHEEGGTL